MEDVNPGVVLPESADGCSWSVVGVGPAYSTQSDRLHFHLSLPVQYSTGFPLPTGGKQRGQRRYVGAPVYINEHAGASECDKIQACDQSREGLPLKNL